MLEGKLNMNRQPQIKRIFSLMLVFAMIISLIPASAVIKAKAADDVTVKLYFDNAWGWDNVYVYAGEGGFNPLLTNTWPGNKISQNNYGYYVYEVTKSISTKFDFIFSNGAGTQTGDLSISASRLAEEEDGVVEVFVKPSGEISYTAPARSGGPTVNGNDVTFTYTNANAASVAVAGTMNDWSTTANVMTKNGSTFTYTMDLEPGVYEYKFVVSGDSSLDNPWISDPSNNAPTMSGGNSIFVVEGLAPATIAAKKAGTISLPANLMYYTTSGETAKAVTYASNTAGVTVSGNIATIANSFAGNQINLTATTQDSDTAKVVVNLYEQQPVTVKVHYDRIDGNESAWNAWIWADNLGGEPCELALEGGEYVATYSVPANKVLYTNSINYIMRKGNWLAQEGTRSIDLSNVVAGTVHSYVKADGSYSNDYSNAIQGAKIKSVKYNRSDNTIIVAASGVLAVSDDSFTIQDLFYKDIEIASVSQEGNTYIITLGEDLTSLKKTLSSYKLSYDGNDYIVTVPNLYDTEEFEEAYTYTGDDLGATYTPEKTTFKIWTPTAVRVNLMIYDHGSSAEDEYGKQPQQWANGVRGDNGVWTFEITGDLKNKYYTYKVEVNCVVNEICDPYARTTGANGKRAMIIDLDSTDPEGWDEDVSPNTGMAYTDAIIYELHVRDLSIDEESGIKDEWKGKFLGLTQTGTTNKAGIPTGLDHIKDLGVTHIHLLPSYDFGSIDETMTEDEKAENLEKQFNWGYDPVNFNVPEGSYSTNPYDGSVRVKEMKQMVQTLHDNNINVIMDVVYNHVQDAGTFCFNGAVPNYFSRTNADGSYSNGSGCGNDTASERVMVRKYIVDSVKYWADEYHIDGFRFDLVGLLDAETINQIVDEVHKTHPYVVFYGEGWTMGTAVKPADTIMATQKNAYATPKFAYFSDTFRDFLKGNGGSWGYIQGATEGDQEGTLIDCFMANTSWIKNPTQVINYASCHDNYTLMDKINITRGEGTAYEATFADRIKMNNLAAAIYLTSEGIPLIHAGEEMLRTKVDSNGNVIENSYNSPDYINSLKWGDLDSAQYQQVRDYYKGLIEFRKNHAALRLTTKTEVNNCVTPTYIEDNVVQFHIDGESVEGEVAKEILIYFNSNKTAKTVTVPAGTWNICVNDKYAGTQPLGIVDNGQATVPAISALVLVKGELIDNESIYLKAATGEKGYINVKYVDESGNPLAEIVRKRGVVGGRYSVSPMEIEGYVLNTMPSNAIGTYKATDIDIVFVYKLDKPTKVNGFTYSARNNNSITLKWNKNAGATGYVIEQYKSGAWTTIKTITSNATTSYKVTGLSASTEYNFRIRAYKQFTSTKLYGDYVSRKIKTFPANVTGFSFKARTYNTVTLRWDKNTSAEGYVIQQYKSGAWTTIKTITSNATTTYKVTGLSGSTTYNFRIRGYKADGSTKLYGSYVTAKVKTLPSNIKRFSFKARTDTYITLRWDKNTSAEGYVIQQYKGGKWTTIKTITSNATTTYKVTGLKASTTYNFRIRGYKADGSKKLYGSYVSAKIKTVPSKVTGFKAGTRGKYSVTLKWDKNTSATGYVLEQYKGGKWVKIKTITKYSTTSYKVSGLKKGTSYKFRIKAYKSSASGSTKWYGKTTAIAVKTLTK